MKIIDQRLRIFALFVISLMAIGAINALADTIQNGTQPAAHVSNVGEDLTFIAAITLLAIATPFVFAWAGNPKSWQKFDRTVLVVGSATQRDPAYKTLAWIFLFALIIQSFHMSEHVAQVIQKFPLTHQEAHGLLGYIFDREWVHLTYNSIYFGVIAILLVGYQSALKGTKGDHGLFLSLIWFVFLFEAFHLAEHALKVMQHLQWGVEDTPGLGGQFFPTIWVHFIYNVIVYIPMILAFFGGGVYQALFSRRATRKVAAASEE